jgi:hypothetical protein
MKETKQLLIQVDSIEGFSYAFTENLLKKLKELQVEGRLFESNGTPTDIANSISSHLGNQLHICTPEGRQEIDGFIKTVEEFLLIFQKK